MSKDNDDEIVKIGLDGPRTAKQERERIANLRENAISTARKLVEDEPDKYDADMLDTVIEELKGIPDDKLDGYLILGRQYEKLCRQVEFDQSEIQQVREMVTGIFPDASEKQCEKDDRSRDDYMFGLGTGRAVWVNKSKPLFRDQGMYNILCCGGVTTMSPQNFHSLDDLLRRLKSGLEKLS
jgi:hypothetical protein